MKKQDMNGVRVAQDIERKYRLQDIETAAAQARAAVSGLQSKLDTSEFEEVLANLEDTIEQALEDISEATEQALEQIQDAIDDIESALDDYLLITSVLTNSDIDNIVEGE